MAYNVSSAFREQLYSGESNFRAILTIGENTIDNDQIASISISSPIIDDSKQVFYVGTFISQKITIKFKNMDGIDVHSGDNVDLSIGQYLNNEWVDVPIGKFLVDDLAEDYFEKCEISCLDYAVKFKPNIDYSLCFTDGKATIKEILEYICDYFNVEIGDYPTINDDVEIGTYDSTVSGKQWISYIAELKGCNAKIDRLGRLTLQPLKQSSNVPINALESVSFELGEEFNITKVTFFDAIRNYTYGDDEGNTLFIRQDNPFVTDTKVVQNIYDNLCAIKYSASGKEFDIEDADAHPINVNTIYGETSQETYTGKNLLQLFTPRSETKNGVTCSFTEDGTITLNGTATANADFTMYYALQTEANQSYTFNQIYISGSATGSVGTYNEDGEHSWKGWDIVRNISSNYKITNAYTTTMNCTTRPIRVFNGVTYSNLKFKLQFTKGSSADYNYEKYVGGIPSPNPDYPQDVNTVKGSNNLKIFGKNLSKVSEGNNIVITDTLQAGTYTFSIEFTNSIGYALKANDGSGATIVSRTPNDSGRDVVSFTLTTPTKIFLNGWTRTTGKTFAESVSEYQLEAGNQATEYEPYEETIKPINLPVENLFDKSGNFNYGNNNYVTSLNNSGQIVSTSNFSVQRSAGLLLSNLEPNAQYTLSGTLVSANGTDANNNANIQIMTTTPSTFTTCYFNSSLIKPYNFTFTFNTGNNTSLWFSFNGKNSGSEGTTETIFDNIQLEKGSKSNTFTPYYYEENLFDKDNANIVNGYLDTAGMVLVSSQLNRILYIPCKPNTTYKISRSIITSTFRVATYDSTPMPSVSSTASTYSISGLIKDNSATSITITTGANAKYLLVHYGRLETDPNIEESLATIQIKEHIKAIELCKKGDYRDYITRNTGKNVCDINAVMPSMINTIGVQTPFYYDSNTGTLTITNNSNDTYLPAIWNNAPYREGINIPVKPNTTYTISFDVDRPLSELNNSVMALNEETNKYEYLSSGLLHTNIFTVNSGNHTQMTFRIGSTASTGTVTHFSNFQIEENNTRTYFEPYGKDEWYSKKAIGKVVLNGSEEISRAQTKSNYRFCIEVSSNIIKVDGVEAQNPIYCNRFRAGTRGETYNEIQCICYGVSTTTDYKDLIIYCNDTKTMTTTEFKNWLSTHNTSIYYVLQTPEYQKITYQPLIDQLNALQNAGLFEGINHITVDTLNEQPSLDIDYFKDSHFSLWSLKTHNYGDFTLDAWDNIDYDLDGTHYLTLNNNNIKYEMSIMSDVESKIPTKQQEVTTNVIGGDDNTNIKMIKTTVDHLNGQVDIISGKQTEMLTDISDLQVANNTITSTVERIEKVEIGENDTVGLRHRISQTEQKVDTITDMFQITGGINIIRNSAFLLSDDVWDFTDYGTNPYHTPLGNSYNSSLSGTIISVAEIKARSMKIKSKSENITNLIVDAEGKTKYTFNFYHKQDADMTTTIKMYSTENNNIKAFNDIVITGQQPLKNYEVSFIPTYANYTLEIIVASATSIGYAYLYDMMLNAGDKQSWQPASDEIYSTTLQMSRLGLQVYSVGDGTITLLGSDGLTSWETSDGKTKGRLVSKRTIDGDRVKTITTQSVKLVSDATKTDEELTHEDKWVETTTKVSGKIAKVIYMESGV